MRFLPQMTVLKLYNSLSSNKTLYLALVLLILLVLVLQLWNMLPLLEWTLIECLPMHNMRSIRFILVISQSGKAHTLHSITNQSTSFKMKLKIYLKMLTKMFSIDKRPTTMTWSNMVSPILITYQAQLRTLSTKPTTSPLRTRSMELPLSPKRIRSTKRLWSNHRANRSTSIQLSKRS